MPSPTTSGARQNGRSMFPSAVVAAAVLAAGLVMGPGMPHSSASSHGDAPLVTADPQIDGTDLYAFTSPDRQDTVTLAANYVPFQLPGSPQQLAPNARYEISIDNDGDGRPDITYRWTITETGNRLLTPLLAIGPVHSLNSPNLAVRQHYTLERLEKGRPAQTLVRDGIVAPPQVNSILFPRYEGLRREAVRDLPGGGRTFAGSAADPFFVNLHTTSLIRFAAVNAPIPLPVPENVQTLALQIPKSELALRGDARRNPVVGVWSTAWRPKVSLSGTGGGYAQVSRMGAAAFNEVYTRCGIQAFLCAAEDRYNASSPVDDWTTADVREGVLTPQRTPGIKLLTGLGAPPNPRGDLKEVYLTGIGKDAGGPVLSDLNSPTLNLDANRALMVPAEEMRLNMSTPVTAAPNKLGLLAGDPQGAPNGRRLTDDASAITLGLLQGALVDKSVDVDSPVYLANAPAKPATGAFPYVALPLAP